MSQLYARVFTKILDSSLAEDWQTRHVFEDLLKLAEDGVVDMTRQAISRRTNIPLEIVSRAIDKLEAPDPASRDPQDDGRRIARLDAHRDWGWVIVNWESYNDIKSKEDERRKVRERVSKYRAKFKPVSGQPELGFPSDSSSSVCENKTENQNQNQNQNHTQAGVTAAVTDVTVTAVTPEMIYNLYPRKEDRQDGLRAITKAMQKHDPAMLLEKTRLFAEAVALRGKDGLRYVPYPASFFNKERFLDDPEMWRIASKGPSEPLWKQLERLEEYIATHVANRQWACYRPENCKPEDVEDLKAAKAKAAEMKKQLVQQQ